MPISSLIRRARWMRSPGSNDPNSFQPEETLIHNRGGCLSKLSLPGGVILPFFCIGRLYTRATPITIQIRVLPVDLPIGDRRVCVLLVGTIRAVYALLRQRNVVQWVSPKVGITEKLPMHVSQSIQAAHMRTPFLMLPSCRWGRSSPLQRRVCLPPTPRV